MAIASVTSHLLNLPRELRHRILLFTLEQHGNIELQQPMWASKGHYAQPIFQVSRLLRREALQAFYEGNCFLWILDLLAVERSDPSRYISMTSDETQHDATTSQNSISPSLIPVLPWEYPFLRTHLRHLHLNMYLPSNLTGNFNASQAWLTEMPIQLKRLVEVLDHGRRLQDLTVLVTANTKRFNTRISLEDEQLKALEVLSEMEIRGNVSIRTRHDFRAARVSIDSLGLEKKMKAG
ncbi:hypothetical protein KC318_g11631 [Hortaea werneckii]|uniref:Uncharacterized protein n=1 Tax=Hortaea werneckii TaxID=91943 RepID=A0A3M6YMD9_HORWE|nr:hypothetical protein KC334_g11837 [Hortaea werneckii]KAI6972420.1 hypothetical protein KC355_g11662 [Hortaea werneckii]KAI7657745.1 hypothetical protein KC318_g11631 [Hortaea werneckii]RMY04190.1 hypothetical protein D0867_10436 [Hortaea werneckii]RMY25284.1 hypothetical protein D0866_11154 [Hortaea werneckii]